MINVMKLKYILAECFCWTLVLILFYLYASLDMCFGSSDYGEVFNIISRQIVLLWGKIFLFFIFIFKLLIL